MQSKYPEIQHLISINFLWMNIPTSDIGTQVGLKKRINF